MTTARAEIKKDYILRKAGETLWRDGFDKSTMKTISKACGFEAGNLYYYFRNKEHILFEVVKADAVRGLEAVGHLEKEKRTSPPQRLKQFVENYVMAVAGPDMPRDVLYETVHKHLSPAHRKKIIGFRDTFQNVLVGIIEDGISSREFACADVRIAAYAISSVLLRVRVWYRTDGRLGPEELGDRISSLMLNLVGFKGEEQCDRSSNVRPQAAPSTCLGERVTGSQEDH